MNHGALIRIKPLEKAERTRNNCAFFRDGQVTFCRATSYAACNPKECPFFRSHADQEASLMRCKENFKNRYGFDGYEKIRYSEHYKQDIAQFKNECDLPEKYKNDGHYTKEVQNDAG